MSFSPKVAVLLATYQGQKYLPEQLDSIIKQTYSNIEIWVSDDGSYDETNSILQNYRNTFGTNHFLILKGPGRGFAINFLSLLSNTAHNAEFYAYSDQDDIWDKNKINRAVDWLKTIPKNIPALYCSRTLLVDKNNKEIGFSPLFTKKPSFANALVQNIGGGNTMVFNSAARQVICKIDNFTHIFSHDWLTYMSVLGVGGEIFYDAYPTVRYRQHDNNLIGMNSRWIDRFTRIKMLFKGRFRKWNGHNIEALNSICNHLTPENVKILKRFQFARNANFIYRLFLLKKSGIYRQTILGNVGLIVAAIFKKI